MFLANTHRRSLIIQATALVLFAAIIVGAGFTAWTRMQEQGMAYGFGVLAKPTGWNAASIFAEQTITDPYWWTIVIALINTVFVSVVCIALATVVGFSVGVGRHAGNPIISKILGIYVETFRNIPLLLQLLFWYTTFTHLPVSREAIELLPSVYLSNQGFFLPALYMGGNGLLGLAAVTLGIVAFIYGGMRIGRFMQRTAAATAPLKPVAIGLLAVAIIAMLSAFLDAQAPVFKGFSFRGGLQIPTELIAIVFSITIFSSAYIAEVVRGGLQAVPEGQWEAAKALGLGPFQTYYYIAVPIAFRTILPSLGNQYVFVVKSTALGIAVGFSDIFSVSVVSITQSGQTIEFLVILMGLYLVLNYSLSSSVNLLNRHLSLAGR